MKLIRIGGVILENRCEEFFGRRGGITGRRMAEDGSIGLTVSPVQLEESVRAAGIIQLDINIVTQFMSKVVTGLEGVDLRLDINDLTLRVAETSATI